MERNERMEKDARHITIAVVLGIMLLIVGALVSGLVFWNKGYKKAIARCDELKPDTVVIHHTDTMKIATPPDTVTVTYYKTVRVPSEAVKPDAVVDSFSVTLPYEQHLARIDSVADIYYSGYDSKIDSVIAYRHYTTQIIKQPYEVCRMPRLTAEFGVAAFYHDKQVFPLLVGEISYNAKNTTFSAIGGVDHTGRWAAGAMVSYRFNLIK